jgi:hypothetical protein
LISGAVTPRPVLTVSPARKNWTFGRWALGTASALACFAIVAGILILFPSRLERSIQKTSRAWTFLRDFAPFRQNFAALKPALVSQSSDPNVPAAEVLVPGIRQFSESIEDGGINSIVVQPGDTMRKIILRALGEYNGATIAQVRKLNPAIADIDFLVAGETVRLPLPLTLITAPGTMERRASTGSSREMSGGE